MTEEWRAIKSHPELQISNLGNVKRSKYVIKYEGSDAVKEVPEEFLPQRLYEGTYYVNFKGHSYPVHILLAETFLDKPDTKEKVYVGFKDEDRTHCTLDNIYYVNASTRIRELIKQGKRYCPSPYRGTKLRCVQDGRTYQSIKELADHLGLPRSKVTRHINQEKELLGKLYKRC